MNEYGGMKELQSVWEGTGQQHGEQQNKKCHICKKNGVAFAHFLVTGSYVWVFN